MSVDSANILCSHDSAEVQPPQEEEIRNRFKHWNNNKAHEGSLAFGEVSLILSTIHKSEMRQPTPLLRVSLVVEFCRNVLGPSSTNA